MSIHKTTRRKWDPYLFSPLFFLRKNIVKNERMFLLTNMFCCLSSLFINTCYEFNSLIQFIEWKRVWSGLKCLVRLANDRDPETQKHKNSYLYHWYCLLLPHPIVPFTYTYFYDILPRKKDWSTYSRYGMTMAVVDPGSNL